MIIILFICDQFRRSGVTSLLLLPYSPVLLKLDYSNYINAILNSLQLGIFISIILIIIILYLELYKSFDIKKNNFDFINFAYINLKFSLIISLIISVSSI